MTARKQTATLSPTAPNRRDARKLVVLLFLVSLYCSIPIGSLVAATLIMWLGSAGFFIENGDFVSLVTWLATEPTSSIGVLQQLIAPICAGLTGSSLLSLGRSRLVAAVLVICCAAITSALLVSALFQLRSVLPDASTLPSIQTYFHGLASTLGVYVLFLLGIRETVEIKLDPGAES